ncbi:CMRF35-like molecule 2 [Grammomys surdaster]|uniref:CMRF35-like molecule 2 n=1 Tax=Grammomys surdaster TaxID=491861 RepID=UPI0010A08276|nr:CMRF35-like molecule 2 [Grammomys surdaster]XP_028608710.1 CMRF35-like molecule 2 [Grammomys surdaster]
MWLCTGLLLLCFQGCLSLTGPGSVSGYVGGSLRVQCQYGKSYKGYLKYWCRGPHVKMCRTIVETDGSKKEKKSGRVSIRDHIENSTITVTMENLSEDDAGSYWCKIQTSFIFNARSRDPSVRVKVHVFPATTPMETTLPATTATLSLVNSGQNRIRTRAMFIFRLWSLLSSAHFQVLVFLKLPLFLSMLCALFWVNRLLGTPGGMYSDLPKSYEV